MRGLEKDRNPGSSENVDKERGDSLEGRTNKVNETHKRQKPKNMLEPRGLEVVEPAKKLMPYVEVPPLWTRPISGGKIKVPEKTPVQAPVVRSSHALKQARKELISGIIKEIFSIPHPVKFEDLAMVSPVARQEAIDLLKKGKWEVPGKFAHTCPSYAQLSCCRLQGEVRRPQRRVIYLLPNRSLHYLEHSSTERCRDHHGREYANTAVCKTVEDFGSRRYVRSSRPKRPLHAKYRQGCAQRGDAGRLLATHAR